MGVSLVGQMFQGHRVAHSHQYEVRPQWLQSVDGVGPASSAALAFRRAMMVAISLLMDMTVHTEVIQVKTRRSPRPGELPGGGFLGGADYVNL